MLSGVDVLPCLVAPIDEASALRSVKTLLSKASLSLYAALSDATDWKLICENLFSISSSAN